MFNGSSDFGTTPAGSRFDLGTISASTQFTFEGWFRWSTVNANSRIIASHAMPGSGGNGKGGWAALENNGQFWFTFGQNLASGTPGWYAAWRTNASVVSLNTWHHVAFVVHNGVPRIFFNGVEQAGSWVGGTGFATSLIGMNTARTDYGLRLGASYTDSGNAVPSSHFHGRMDEVRITGGVARYTSNFTVPSAPFPTS